jgi:hypothetical protein
MNEVRKAFLDCAHLSAQVLRLPGVAEGWDLPSALDHFSMRGLAGHLVRATGSVEAYLDRGIPDGAPVGAAEYYAAAVDSTDLQSELHVAIRGRGEEMAAGGHSALVAKLDGIIERLEVRLAEEPADRTMEVYKGIVVTLDDYLVTRLVEQLVHCDDLAVSVSADTPAFPPAAVDIVFANLVEVARIRHGDLAVLRAFTRGERDAANALRVF